MARHRGARLPRGLDGRHPRPRGRGRRRAGPRERPPAPAPDREQGGARARDLRPGRHHRVEDDLAHGRRPRDHAHRPPGRPPGAVLQGRPGARGAGERDRHGQRLRGGEAARARRADRLRELRGRVRPARRRSPRARSTASTSWRTRGPDGSTGRRTASRASGCGRSPSTAPAATRASPQVRRSRSTQPSAGSRTALPSAAGRSSTTQRTSRGPSCRRRARRRTARTRSASAARRPRSPTSSTAVEAEIPGAEITFDEAPLPFPDELPAPWFDAPLTPLEQGIRETAEVLRGVI